MPLQKSYIAETASFPRCLVLLFSVISAASSRAARDVISHAVNSEGTITCKPRVSLPRMRSEFASLCTESRILANIKQTTYEDNEIM